MWLGGFIQVKGGHVVILTLPKVLGGRHLSLRYNFIEAPEKNPELLKVMGVCILIFQCNLFLSLSCSILQIRVPCWYNSTLSYP